MLLQGNVITKEYYYEEMKKKMKLNGKLSGDTFVTYLYLFFSLFLSIAML